MPQTLGCHSKSNCSGNFSVFTLSFFHILRHCFPHYTGSSALEHPASSGCAPRLGVRRLQGKGVPAHLEGRTPEVMCWVAWTLGSPLDDSKLTSRAFVKLSPSSTPAPRWASRPQRAVVCLRWALCRKRSRESCGPGPDLLVGSCSGQNSE